MKSCIGILIIFLTFVVIVGGGALVWYLSTSADITRKVVVPSLPPKAAPVYPRAVPVR